MRKTKAEIEKRETALRREIEELLRKRASDNQIIDRLQTAFDEGAQKIRVLEFQIESLKSSLKAREEEAKSREVYMKAFKECSSQIMVDLIASLVRSK